MSRWLTDGQFFAGGRPAGILAQKAGAPGLNRFHRDVVASAQRVAPLFGGKGQDAEFSRRCLGATGKCEWVTPNGAVVTR